MRFLLRSLILLLLILWVGAVMYFPVLAWAAFSTLPSQHLAGMVVVKSLKTLHTEGFIAGVLLILFLALAQRLRAFSRNVLAPMILVVVMLGLTAFSQFSVIPRMENDRIDAGGVINAVPPANPYRADFDRLHHESVTLLEGVLIGGILATLAVAWAAAPEPSGKPQA
jgi:hypothetical protein